jgi:K+-transporting ATPase A subunit
VPTNDLVTLITLAAAVLLLTPPLGAYIARVMEGERTLLSPAFGPVERVTYRLLGTDLLSGRAGRATPSRSSSSRSWASWRCT